MLSPPPVYYDFNSVYSSVLKSKMQTVLSSSVCVCLFQRVWLCVCVLRQEPFGVPSGLGVRLQKIWDAGCHAQPPVWAPFQVTDLILPLTLNLFRWTLYLSCCIIWMQSASCNKHMAILSRIRSSGVTLHVVMLFNCSLYCQFMMSTLRICYGCGTMERTRHTYNGWCQSFCGSLCLLIAVVKYDHPIVLGSELSFTVNTQHRHLHLNETPEKLFKWDNICLSTAPSHDLCDGFRRE